MKITIDKYSVVLWSYNNGYKELLHREDGPSAIYFEDRLCEFWVNGELLYYIYNDEEYWVNERAKSDEI